MRIAIMGSGGVGGTYGARLAAAGHDVTFIARGAHAAAMRSSGLNLRSERGDLHLKPVQVTSDPCELGPVDLVLVAVKLWDTEAAAEAILPLVGAGTCVVSLQNGVEKDEALARIVGAEHILGGVTYILAALAEPGVVVHSGRLQCVIVGELPGELVAELGGGTNPVTDRVRAVVEAFAGAGIDAEASADIRRATWEKFIFLSSNAAVTAVTRRTIGEVRALAPTRRLLYDAMAEVASLARAEGVEIAGDFVDDRLRFIDTLPAGGRASMANDLLRGQRLELEWLSGAVVRRGERAGVATPVHRALYAALFPFAGGAPPDPSR